MDNQINDQSCQNIQVVNSMTNNLTNPAKRIESPLSAFNNLINQITEKLQLIYLLNNEKNPYIKKCANSSFINQLLFEEKCITIFGCIKILLQKDDIVFKFCGSYDSAKLELINRTLKNETELKQLFQHYLYIIDSVNNNYDSTISQKYVEMIFNQIINKTIEPNKMFLVPYKNKIKHLYDSEDKTLDKLYNRYSYVIKFSVKNNMTFSYRLTRVLSSELNESKSMENVRFEDIEVLKENTLSIDKLEEFLTNLFYYGEIYY
jgi:hypothetical protein